MINMQTLKHGTSCNCSYCGHRVVKAHRSVVRDGKTVRGNSRRQSAVINLYLDACTVANIKRDQGYFLVLSDNTSGSACQSMERPLNSVIDSGQRHQDLTAEQFFELEKFKIEKRLKSRNLTFARPLDASRIGLNKFYFSLIFSCNLIPVMQRILKSLKLSGAYIDDLRHDV